MLHDADEYGAEDDGGNKLAHEGSLVDETERVFNAGSGNDKTLIVRGQIDENKGIGERSQMCEQDEDGTGGGVEDRTDEEKGRGVDEGEKRCTGKLEEGEEKDGTTGEGEMDRTYKGVLHEAEGDLGGGGEENNSAMDMIRDDDGDGILEQIK